MDWLQNTILKVSMWLVRIPVVIDALLHQLRLFDAYIKSILIGVSSTTWNKNSRTTAVRSSILADIVFSCENTWFLICCTKVVLFLRAAQFCSRLLQNCHWLSSSRILPKSTEMYMYSRFGRSQPGDLRERYDTDRVPQIPTRLVAYWPRDTWTSHWLTVLCRGLEVQ